MTCRGDVSERPQDSARIFCNAYENLTSTALLPRSAPYVLWDDELAGFGCTPVPLGQAQLRGALPAAGQPQAPYQPTIGTYGLHDRAQARADARVVLKRRPRSPVRTRRRNRPARRAAEQRPASVLTVAKLVEQMLTRSAPAPQPPSGCAAGMPQPATSKTPSATSIVSPPRLRLRGRPGRPDAVLRAAWNQAPQPSTHRRMHGAISLMHAGRNHRAWSLPSPRRRHRHYVAAFPRAGAVARRAGADMACRRPA